MVHKVDQFVGARLRDFRTARGLSQSELASQVGISFQQLQKYERATNRISSSRLWEICRELSTPISDFFPDIAQVSRDETVALASKTPGNIFQLPSAEEPEAEEMAPQHVIRTARKIAQIRDKRIRSQILLLIDACSKASTPEEGE